MRVKLPLNGWVLPLPRLILLACPATFRLAMPKLLSVRSSPAWLMPSWLASCQIRRLAYAASALLMAPSALMSRSARASYPLAAVWPARGPRVSTVLSPNNSRPESIRPFPLRSSTTMPSSALIQPVAVLMPSPSMSKRMGAAGLIPTASMPSLSRSSTKGSRGVSQLRAAVTRSLTKGVTASRKAL